MLNKQQAYKEKTGNPNNRYILTYQTFDGLSLGFNCGKLSFFESHILMLYFYSFSKTIVKIIYFQFLVLF